MFRQPRPHGADRVHEHVLERVGSSNRPCGEVPLAGCLEHMSGRCERPLHLVLVPTRLVTRVGGTPPPPRVSTGGRPLQRKP